MKTPVYPLRLDGELRERYKKATSRCYGPRAPISILLRQAIFYYIEKVENQMKYDTSIKERAWVDAHGTRPVSIPLLPGLELDESTWPGPVHPREVLRTIRITLHGGAITQKRQKHLTPMARGTA